MAIVKAIHHVSLKCADDAEFDMVLRFYTETMGLQVLRQWKKGDTRAAMLTIGGGIIELFAQGKESDATGVINHFSFATDDVDACAAAMKAAGCTVVDGPRDVCISSNPPLPVRIAFVKGLMGETIELFQEK